MRNCLDIRARFGALVTILGTWYQRERERRELSRLRLRDFGDLPVTLDLICYETRRWPWQKPSAQWSQLTRQRENVSESRRGRGETPQQILPPTDGGDAVPAEPLGLSLS